MVQEAKANEAEDRKRREMADVKNNADSLAYQAEKALNELGDKVPANDRQEIEGKIKQLREALEGDDLAEIKRLSEEVQQASYALSQQMYAQQAGPETGEAGTPPSGDSDDSDEEGEVVEGEFREA
jgi:molecular chaperone DnaK